MTDYSLECVKVDFALTGQAATLKAARVIACEYASYSLSIHASGALAAAILALSPIAYWKLDETSGTTAINYGSLGAAANGTYSGVTLNQIDAPGGTRAGLWDGVNDYTNIYSAALSAAFSGQIGTVLLFVKPYNVGVLTDGAERRLIEIYASASGRMLLRKLTTNNTLQYLRISASTKSVTKSDYASTDWALMASTYSTASDELKAYYNNSQEGATQSSIGAFGGSTTHAVIGSNYLAASERWYGYICHVVLFTSVLSLANIQAINTAGQAAEWTTITVQRKLTAAHGSMALSGQDAGLAAARLITAVYGAFALTGQDAALYFGRLITAVYGAFALTGQDAGLLAARQLELTYGDFSLSGQDAGLAAARLLVLVVDAFALSGQDAEITWQLFIPVPPGRIYRPAADNRVYRPKE